MKRQVNRKPQAWQLDSSNIETEKVQYWKGGTMMTAMMTNEHAKAMVVNGRAFVMTSQAIGALDENGEFVR